MIFRAKFTDKETIEGIGEEQLNLEEDMTRLHEAYYFLSSVILVDLTFRDYYEMKKATGHGRK